LRYSQAQINTLKQIWRMTEGSTVQRAATGTVKVLCVLASFSNKALVKTNSEFENLMNQVGYSVGGANGSVKDFYLEDSYGNLNIQVTVIGPVTVSQSVYYYSKSADPTEQRYRTFANEVVDLADPLVDYSQFATNGQVESFHIIFAGYGNEAIGDYQQIHAHQWTLPNIVTKDGVQLYNYSCSPELRGNSGSSITNIGVICHELGHICQHMEKDSYRFRPINETEEAEANDFAIKMLEVLSGKVKDSEYLKDIGVSDKQIINAIESLKEKAENDK